MLSKDPSNRPDCTHLLAKSKEWTIDKNAIKSDEYYNEFNTLLDKSKDLDILQRFLELK